jgi:hypothetical protein
VVFFELQAIEVDLKTAEAWKRRGQAQAAIGETAEVQDKYFIL